MSAERTRQQRHQQLNDILWRALKPAQIPAIKEPVSLLQQDGKRPDGTTLLPWSHGKPMAWDVTVPDTFAESYIDNTAWESGAAADRASANKANKYSSLSNSHIFYPVAVETAGTWNRLAIELIQEIGKRASTITDDARKTTFLFQRMSIALQRGKAIAFANTYSSL